MSLTSQIRQEPPQVLHYPPNNLAEAVLLVHVTILVHSYEREDGVYYWPEGYLPNIHQRAAEATCGSLQV